MEHIREALERARSHSSHPQDKAVAAGLSRRVGSDAPAAINAGLNGREVLHERAHLEAKRIIAHDRSDSRSKSFEMLRTQVLQTMDQNGWQVLAVTSATPGCGKTSTAINLAMSIARQSDRTVVLVDLDFQKPQVSAYLGLDSERGVVGVLEGRTSASDALVQARIGSISLPVIPCELATANSSEFMTSKALSTLLQQLKSSGQDAIVILDLPPILSGDDVIAILPKVDCALMIVAVGVSTSTDIKECGKHLQSTPIVRVVVNKATEQGPGHYYSYFKRS